MEEVDFLADLSEKLTSACPDDDANDDFTDTIKNLAAAVGASSDSGDSGSDEKIKVESFGADQSEQNETAATDAGDIFANLDLSGILNIFGLITNPPADKNVDFLLALKPILNEDRAPKIDNAVKLMRLAGIVMMLRQSGMLSKVQKMF
jgi:hypothetical protein